MVVRPEREVDEDAPGLLRNADTGDLLVRETGDFFELRSGNRCDDAEECEENKARVHTKENAPSGTISLPIFFENIGSLGDEKGQFTQDRELTIVSQDWSE